MGYRAMGIGRDEILSPLGEALVQIEDNRKPFPRPINISLDHTEPKAKYHDLNVRPYEIIGDTNPKIGVINLMGPDLRDELKTLEKFLPNDKQLPKALNAFAEEGVEVGVILLHEYPNLDPKLFPKGSKKRLDKMEELRIEQATKVAEFCAAERKNNAKIPPIQVMMILTHEPDTESEPRSIMRPLDKLDTQVIEIGHKGKYVGLLGVYRGAKGIELRYQMVQMTPDWKTKEGAEKGNAVIALLENYNKHLKDEKMLDQYKRTQHFNQIDNQGRLKATYVGSAACFGCHPQARKVWTGPEKDAPHYIATDALEKLKHPSGRQYDPECMMCHTTGFKHHGGYNDLILNLAKKQAPNAQQIADHNKSLRGVGCESCHGPGSEHVKLEKDDAKGKEKLYPFINPYGLTKEERDLEAKEAAKAASPKEQVRLKLLFDERMRKMAQNLCMKCHDHDNDVNWGQPGKDTADKWRPLIHRTPGAGVALPKAKDNDGPAVVDPPIVIEVIPEKKK
jgi:hypothetical protein